jgi:hypothetical protein
VEYYRLRRFVDITLKLLLRNVIQELYVQAAETKPIFDRKMKALAATAKNVDMQLPKELKKTPRMVEKSQLRPGMKGVSPYFHLQ